MLALFVFDQFVPQQVHPVFKTVILQMCCPFLNFMHTVDSYSGDGNYNFKLWSSKLDYMMTRAWFMNVCEGDKTFPGFQFWVQQKLVTSEIVLTPTFSSSRFSWRAEGVIRRQGPAWLEKPLPKASGLGKLTRNAMPDVRGQAMWPWGQRDQVTLSAIVATGHIYPLTTKSQRCPASNSL